MTDADTIAQGVAEQAAEVAPLVARGTWADRLALGLAYVVNPLVLPALLFGLVLAHFAAPVGEIAYVVGIGLVCFGFVPLGYVVWLVKTRQIATIEVRDRSRRWKPFLVGTASCGAALVLLALTAQTAAPLIVAMAACLVLNTVVLLVITLRWKISVHVAAVAGFVSILAFVAWTPWASAAAVVQPPLVGVLVPLVPLMMWARVRTEAHTWGQSMAGALVGFTLPFVELSALRTLGLFAGL